MLVYQKAKLYPASIPHPAGLKADNHPLGMCQKASSKHHQPSLVHFDQEKKTKWDIKSASHQPT